MPFKSKRQLQTCFAKEIEAKIEKRGWTWDCVEWLNSTPTCKGHRSGEMCVNHHKIGGVKIGPRGGYYFYPGGIKVYIPKGKTSIKEVKKLYKL